MKNNNIEKMVSHLRHQLKKAVPEGQDLWPALSTRLAQRNLATETQCRQGFSWFAIHRVPAFLAFTGVLTVVIGLYLWMIQPKAVDAQEILNRAHNAQTLTTSSGIQTFTLIQRIDQRSNSGELHAEIKRWYQEPGRWRVESRWNGTAPDAADAITVVSDGTSEWMQQGDSVTVSRATHQPENDDLTPWGRGKTGLTDVLNQVSDLYPSPNLQGEEIIAGRTAYVIDLGLPKHFSNSAPEINNGRHVIWIDKQTFFLLKAVQYSPTDGSLVGVMEVAQIKYNLPIDHGVFLFTPSPGTQINDLRSGSHPSLTKSDTPGLTSLSEARQKVSFSVFVPTVVPAGLVPQAPIIDEGQPAFVKVNYHIKDGSIGLSIVNGPAGSGLDADPRKKGEAIRLQGDIPGHFLNNEPQFGGPILWWDKAGTYIALSGPDLSKTDLVNIAVSMSPTADIK